MSFRRPVGEEMSAEVLSMRLRRILTLPNWKNSAKSTEFQTDPLPGTVRILQASTAVG
jgi:hypothetical protein